VTINLTEYPKPSSSTLSVKIDNAINSNTSMMIQNNKGKGLGDDKDALSQSTFNPTTPVRVSRLVPTKVVNLT
jgi:hypothetical protein